MMPLIPPEDGYFLEPLLETGADISDILPDGTRTLCSICSV